MRRYDWTLTPVGDPGAWPASLRTTVNLLLNSKFPMFLLWGDDYTQFYNDAYLPSFGTDGKHPAALGQAGKECWQEAWSLLGPLLDQVRLGGEAIWKEDQPVPMYRNGRIETTYWTFSYSPVLNEAGNIGGVLSTCFETTEKVLSLKKIQESSDELLFAIEATELGTWDLNPDTGHFTANVRLKEWFGLRPEENIPLSTAISCIAAADRDRVAAAITRALDHTSGGQYQELYTIIHPVTDRRRIVMAKGRAWFGDDQKAYRFNGTLQDITEQRLAELAQKEAEMRFRQVTSTSPTGLWLSDTEGNIIYINKTLTDWTGIAYEDLLGQGWLQAVVPDDRQKVTEIFSRAIAARAHYDVEFRLIMQNGQAAWCRSAGDPFSDEQGHYAGYSGFCLNIQEQKDINDRITKSREQLLHSFEAAPVAIATIDKHELTFRMANSFYAALVGRKPEDLVDKPLLAALPELEGQGFDLLLNQVIQTGIAYTSKEVGVDLVRDGRLEKIFVDFAYQPQADQNGEVYGVLVVATDVTTQVTSRQDIEESEFRFRSLVTEAPIATCLFVGPDMIVEVANDIMLRYWGKDRTVIGKPLREALPELVGQPFLGILDNIYVTGETHSERNAAARLEVDGRLQTFYFDYTYKPLRNAFGNVYGIMDMAIEVTEQVIAVRQLEESEQFARHIFYNSPVAKLVFIGPDMILRDANEAMLHLFGRDASILNKPIMESIPEFRQTDLKEKYLRVLQTGEAYFEYAQKIQLSKNGEQHQGYYDYIYKPLTDASGQHYGVVCTAVDVTQQVTARQQIEMAEASLRGAIELAELATWRIDLVKKKVHYSERMQQWLGVAASELNVDASPRIHTADQERVGQAIHTALQPGGNGRFDEIYTIVHITTGQERVIHASGQTVFDENGAPLILSGTAQDITLQRKLQADLELKVQQRTEELAASNEELESMNESLRRSNEELFQYAYVASHDLQEPLRKIRMFSSILDTQKDVPEFSRNVIGKISKSAERMSMLIKDLLEFSRLVNSDQLKQPIDLNRIVKEVLNDFELRIAESGAEITVNTLPIVAAVSLQMNQLFYNIISNALKFVKQGERPVVKISYSVAAADEVKQHIRKPMPGTTYHKISISDNGIGFEEKYATQIFEVFKRLHDRDAYSGSGIGLAICRRIVDNHSGYLLVDSVINQGTVFHIVLPG